MIPEFGRPVWSVLALLAVCWSAQQAAKPPSEANELKTPIKVSLCQLLTNSEIYNDREVVVQATYSHGSEWLVLYSPDCSGTVWLDLSHVKNHAAVKPLGPLRESAKGNLEVHGIYMSGGHYGHLGTYAQQIVAHKVSAVEVPQKPPAEK
jgi:hypothetical protein